jgi:hypothetical protein
MMRILSITVLAIAAVSFDARGARAAEGPWCANIISAPATFTRIASITRSRPAGLSFWPGIAVFVT